MKTENAILAGLGIAIAGFFGYRYYKRKKDEKAAAEAAEMPALPTTSGGVTSQPSGFSDYQKKVMTLQTKLGIGVDGSAGPQTNNTVKSWFPTLYATLGNVSSANVDQYIAAKKETGSTTTTTTASTNIAKPISAEFYTPGSYTRKTWEAMKKKGFARVIKQNGVNAYYYNSINNTYVETGGGFIVKANQEVSFANSKLTDKGIITVMTAYGTSGQSYGPKLVLILPSQIYVP